MVWDLASPIKTSQIFYFNSSLDGLGQLRESRKKLKKADFNSSLDGLGHLMFGWDWDFEIDFNSSLDGLGHDIKPMPSEKNLLFQFQFGWFGTIRNSL